MTCHKSHDIVSNPQKGFSRLLLKDRFLVQCRIGKGSFGDVYKGVDVKTRTNVAIKVQCMKDPHFSGLHLERDMYKALNVSPVTVGIPNIYYFGVIENFAILVMDLLGPSLEDIFEVCNHNFSIKTVCMLGVQIFQRLEYIHKIGLIFRDVKPENFVMGLGSCSHILYIVDMGLSKFWRTSSGEHTKIIKAKSLTGTPRYASINAHNGLEQSRRDDVESAAYLILYLLRGNLPWQSVSCGNDPNYTKIGVAKKNYTGRKLGGGFPKQFAELVDQVRNLQFDEEPHYKLYISLLLDVLSTISEKFDYNYTWNKLC